MSGAEWVREGWRLLLQSALALAGWLLIVPLVWLVPRRKDLIVVIGRDGGKFTDNTKYFFLQAQSLLPSDVRCVWLSSFHNEQTKLESCGLPVAAYPSWRGVWLLMRAGILVVDSVDWHLRMRRFLLSGTRKVQLWHGVGFKRIEINKIQHEASTKKWISNPLIARLRSGLRFLTGRNTHYDLVNTTSRFYLDEVFRPAFSSNYFLASGYPRNTFDRSDKALLGADTHITHKAKAWKSSGRKIVLIVPTFRDSRSTSVGLDADTCNILDNWCEVNKAELIFKFHPLEKGATEISGKRLHQYESGADLYPLMFCVDAMVTDYSSIYMDFLLLDKPVLFLVPDMEDYVQHDRQIQFDYATMTPGPKVKTWTELLLALEQQWSDDIYRIQRQALALKAFDGLPQKEATPKILQLMLEKGWLRSNIQTTQGVR